MTQPLTTEQLRELLVAIDDEAYFASLDRNPA